MSKYPLVELGDVCDVRDGTHDSPKYVIYGYPLITSKNIINDEIDFINVNYICEEDYNKINIRSKVDIGDIIMPMIGTIGNPIIIKCDTNFAIKNVALIKFIDNVILNRYLIYILKSDIFKIYVEKENRGGTQKFLSLKNIRSLPIPLPPIQEQKHIADTLDTASDLINLHKQSIIELDNLIQSTFIDMFGDPVINEMGWEVKPLEKLGDLKNGINFDSNERGFKIKCLGVGDFKNLSTIKDISTLSTISLNEIPSKSYLLKENDIIFVRSNGNKKLVGRCVSIIKNNEQITFSGFCIRFRNKSSNIIITYILYTFKQNSIRQHMFGQGGNIKNLNQKMLNVLKIPIPPIDLQEKFADIVSAIEEQKSISQQALDDATMLYNCLLQDFFE